MYSLKIFNKNDLCSVLCIDEEHNEMMCVFYDDDELNFIIQCIIDNHGLRLITKDKINSSIVIMDEYIQFNDKRFVDALQYNINDKYDIKDIVKYDNLTLKQCIQQFR